VNKEVLTMVDAEIPPQSDDDTRRGLLASFSLEEVELLQVIVDTVIPADAYPGGWRGGVAALLQNPVGAMDELVEPLRAAVRRIDTVARNVDGKPFFELSPARRLELVEHEYLADTDGQGSALELEVRGGWEAPESVSGFTDEATGEGAHAQTVAALVTVAFEGFYSGISEPAGWSMVGYHPVPAGVTPVDRTDPDGIPVDELLPGYEVVVIGAGAGGGVAACELAEAGRQVLLVERARPMRDSELRDNHIQGKRDQLYGVTAGPGPGNPRVWEHSDGTVQLLRGDGNMGTYGLNAMTLGGGTRLWQGMAWRFYEEDFKMASTYGSPADCTLVDWPFGYDQLAPFYDRVEWELGVAGDVSSPALSRVKRARALPMPAFEPDETRRVLGAAAESLGWTTSPIPFALNTVPRDGRPACVRCAQNIGHACPVNAKNGSHNTFTPRALETGAHLLTTSQAVQIEHDRKGTATGVRLIIDSAQGPMERTVRAQTVVVAAGAVETPRLLLASGLGNEWVGRNHHSHGVAMPIDLSGRSPKNYVGPGHSVATSDWLHREGLAWGGGIIVDAATFYPGQKAPMHLAAGVGLGEAHKRWMRETPPPLGVLAMTQEIPHVSARVMLDPNVTDRHGMPAARLAGQPSRATTATVDFMMERAREWLTAAGATNIMTHIHAYGFAVGTEHSAGTARLGEDPASSACDIQGRLWGSSNIWVADASLHPTNGGVNPALTVMANAMRVAGFVAGTS
jgi:choline dehydrogenase-like flavoprotein